MFSRGRHLICIWWYHHLPPYLQALCQGPSQPPWSHDVGRALLSKTLPSTACWSQQCVVSWIELVIERHSLFILDPNETMLYPNHGHQKLGLDIQVVACIFGDETQASHSSLGWKAQFDFGWCCLWHEMETFGFHSRSRFPSLSFVTSSGTFASWPVCRMALRKTLRTGITQFLMLPIAITKSHRGPMPKSCNWGIQMPTALWILLFSSRQRT